jgi:hypothetical protein
MRPTHDFWRSDSYQRGSYQMRSYQVAKLAVTAWIHRLARRWARRGVTANLLDPGVVKSELGEHFEGPALLGFMMSRVIPFFAAVDPERESDQYVRLATDPALANVSGMYFVGGKEKPEDSSSLSLDPGVRECIDEAAKGWAAPFVRLPGVSADNAVPKRKRTSWHVAAASERAPPLVSHAAHNSKARRLRFRTTARIALP